MGIAQTILGDRRAFPSVVGTGGIAGACSFIERRCQRERSTYNSNELHPPRNIPLTTEHTNTWPELLIGLYDNLTGRGAEITYEFDNMHIKIPSGTGSSAEHAEWILHGIMRIRTKDTHSSPN